MKKAFLNEDQDTGLDLSAGNVRSLHNKIQKLTGTNKTHRASVEVTQLSTCEGRDEDRQESMERRGRRHCKGVETRLLQEGLSLCTSNIVGTACSDAPKRSETMTSVVFV